MKAKNAKSKRRLALLLAALFLISSVLPAFADVCPARQSGLVRFTVTPEKTEYAAGEEIRLRARAENVSFTALKDAEFYFHYENKGTYLVTGDAWYYRDTLSGGESWDTSFNLFENTELKEKGASMGAPVQRLLQFFARMFSNLAPFLRRTENNTPHGFSEFSAALSRVFAPRVTEKLGEVTVLYDGKEVRCSFYLRCRRTAIMNVAPAKKTGDAAAPCVLLATLTPAADSVCGLIFGADFAGNAFSGGFFFLDAAGKRAGIARMKNGVPAFLAVKYADVTAGESYAVRLQNNGERIFAWLCDNPLGGDPYPLFDLPAAFAGTGVGVCGAAADVSLADAPPAYAGETYQNPLYPNSADPFILRENGLYYLYATNNGTGFSAATSADLVHWTDIGQIAFMADLAGDRNFWAPEVYRYRGRFYLFYSVDGHLAVAAADSPAGPFKKETDGYLLERDAIDGHVFFDDDGKIYLYVVHFGEGNHLWVYELNDDLLSVKPDSGVKLSVPEGKEGRINEGPAVLKHNGYYYLTYSGEDYQSVNYDVFCMVSKNPKGPFTRVDYNPVLCADTYIHGTGHHCFVASPDGSELFIAYHCHNTLTQIHPRALCIDRVKFVPTESGVDKLVVYGPTVTPQPLPR